MTDSLEKRRYSISQSGKFKQKYKQRQQISVEIYSPEVNTAQVSVLNEICKGSKVYDEVSVKNLEIFKRIHMAWRLERN
jgi:hypothetical protein